MAIVVVVVIGWIALQRGSQRQFIAENVSSDSPAPAAVPNEVARSSSPSVEQFKGQVGERKESPARAGEKTAANQEPSEIKQKEAIAEENKARVATTDDFRDREELAKRNQTQPVAPAPAAGVAGTTTVAASRKPDAVSERRDEVAQKKESEADKAKVMNEPPARAADSTAGPAKSSDVKSSPKACQPTRPLPAAAVVLSHGRKTMRTPARSAP